MLKGAKIQHTRLSWLFKISARTRRFLEELGRSAPARLALIAFAITITVIATLLMLPISTSSGTSPRLVDAVFTATSAVCVTGISVVPTATYWSFWGQIFIMIGIKIGGLGVMTLSSLLGLAVSKRIGLTQRLLVASERGGGIGELGALLKSVLVVSAIGETFVAVAIYFRFVSLSDPYDDALWHSIFMGISTFNNAGFDNLPFGTMAFAGDWWFSFPIVLGALTGSIGFPVVLDLRKHKFKYHRWSLHTKLTLVAWGTLMAIGTFSYLLFEWNNERTVGNLGVAGKVMFSLFHSTMARSTGIATTHVENWHETTWFVTDVLMFIGGGSAGTAGGIKVTTFAVLILAVVAEARGDRDIEVFKRRIPPATVRLAIAATLLGAAMVGVATVILLSITDWRLDQVLFEAISAFGTCGLSTGVTASLPVSAKYVMVILMFSGRTGTMTLAAALALRERQRVIRMAEERPLIG